MQKAKQISAVFLSLVILLAGLNITISKMVCLESGHVKISLQALKDCCPEKQSNSPQTVKGQCCDISNLQITLKDTAPAQAYKDLSHATVLQLFYLENSPQIHFVTNSSGFVANNNSPPPSGDRLHLLYSVFRI